MPKNRIVGLFYTFKNVFKIWFQGRQLDSLCGEITHSVASGKFHCTNKVESKKQNKTLKHQCQYNCETVT